MVQQTQVQTTAQMNEINVTGTVYLTAIATVNGGNAAANTISTVVWSTVTETIGTAGTNDLNMTGLQVQVSALLRCQ